jgi:hypothetical protein
MDVEAMGTAGGPDSALGFGTCKTTGAAAFGAGGPDAAGV